MSVERAIYKIWHFGCRTCHTERERLQWSYDPAPECCGAPMEHGVRGSRSTVQIITDDVPGGFVVENGFSAPQKFYSKSEHRAALETGRRADGRVVGRGGMRIADRGECRS